MLRMTLLPLLLLAPLAQAVAADRATLMSVYAQVVEHNSDMAAARENYLARREAVPLARARLLPQVALDAEAGDVRSDRRQVEQRSGSLYRLSLDQPLFDLSRWFDYKAAQSENEQAELDFSAFQQQLILDTASRYFDTLLAEDNLATAKAELRAFDRQLQQTRLSYDAGLSDQNDMLSAQASFDRASANLIDSQRRSEDAYQALMRLTGQAQPALAGIRHSLPVQAPVPERAEAWVEQAMAQNLRLRASQAAVSQAGQTLRSSKADHLPTFNLAMGYAEGDSDLMDSSAHFGQRPGNQRDSSVMVQMKLPLFSGGGTSARVRQATHELARTEYGRTSLEREVLEGSRNAFRAVVSDVEQVRARRQSIISSQGSLRATEAGYEVGSRNIVDILDAQRDLYNAVRDYNVSRYAYIVDSLRLKQQAGSLSPEDLRELAGYLKLDYEPERDFLPSDLRG